MLFENKSTAIMSMLEIMFPFSAKAVGEGRCPCCKKKVHMESACGEVRREYELSGMCGECQYNMFV